MTESDRQSGEGHARSEVSELLMRWSAGDGAALDLVLPLIYDELHRLARRSLSGEGTGHTLQTTALINEAYLRLVGSDIAWEGRAHFLAVAARTMRRILVDHARARRSAKRGRGVVAFTLDEAGDISTEPREDVLALNEAIERLLLLDERKGRAVELHYFGGLTYEETAAALGISPATVHRELRLAKSWLYSQLRQDSTSS